MNREIIFRGKIIDNGEWAYGSLVVEEDKYYIALNINDNIKRDDYDVYMLEVIPKTVGQYTGLHDKNGKAIYEGNIVKVNDEIIAEVIWENDYLGYFLYANEENSIDSFENGEQPLYDYWGSIEVIGNIYDNPELLGGE